MFLGSPQSDRAGVYDCIILHANDIQLHILIIHEKIIFSGRSSLLSINVLQVLLYMWC